MVVFGCAEVPGLPVIGNLLQLKEKKPHMTFARWAKTYGPIYSIKTGSNMIVVLNNNDVAKEVAHLSRSLVVLFTDVPKYLPLGICAF